MIDNVGKDKRRTTAIAFLIVGIVLGATLAAVPSLTAQSQAQPADKVVAMGSKMVVLGPGESVPILSATMKTSSPTDLILSVSMECSILTQLTTGPSGKGGTDSATSSARIRAWIEIDGQIVPINSMSSDPRPGDNTDKVTFCNRTYSRTVTDTEDPLDGQDTENDTIDTMDANAFNWIRLNAGSDTHEIVVKATLTQQTMGDATVKAYIGTRSLIVEPTKMANNAVV